MNKRAEDIIDDGDDDLEIVNVVEKASKKAESDIDIEVIDDTPEHDRGRPRRDPGREPEIPNDDEIKDYGEKVQKRIKDLRFEFHEERRAKEEAQRQLDAAAEYARRQHAELMRLRSALSSGEETLMTTAKSGATAAVESAKAKLRRAQEEGDAEAIAEAQTELSSAIFEAKRWEGYRPQYKFDPRQAQQQQPQQVPQRQIQPQRPDPRATEWADRNPWFQKDKKMTGYAFGLHEELVSKGVDPRSDEYYDALDRDMRQAFPSYFKGEAGSPRRKPDASSDLVVSSSSRTGGKTKRIQLTRSQVELANKIGVPLEVYAREVMKGQKNG